MRARGKRWARVLIPAACSLAFASRDARANGRLPSAHELVFSATEPSFVAIEATYGLFLSQDTGASFGWVCEPAIGYPSKLSWDPPIGITSTSVLAGTPYQGSESPYGVSVSKDQGCSWEFTLTASIVDIVVRRDDPHSALALASSYSGRDDAGASAYLTQVFATPDDGATWAQQGMAVDPDVAVETLDIAPSDPNTMYIGGARTLIGADGSINRTGTVLASTNGGASYTATEIPLLPIEFESSAFVSAVDPNDPQRVYVRISQSTGSTANSNIDRLIVSDDGAATFRTVYQATGALPGFALSSDGSKVFIGDSGAGVLVAAAPPVDSGAPYSFAQRSTDIVECLAWSSGNLYACTRQSSQNTLFEELAVSTNDGLTFSPVFRFGCVSGPLACESGTIASTCGMEFPGVQPVLGSCDGGSAADASAPDSSVPDSDASAGTSRPRASSCGCEAGEAAGEVGGLSAIALLVAMVLRRRRAA
jgi:MYXO-CTERM domain-containing protein